MPINDNSIDLSKFKGPITPCPFCNTGRAKSKGAELTLQHRACVECMGNGFIAKCLNCEDGLHTEGAVWDGGKTSHTSVCNMCGGRGHFPARRPKDWKDEDEDEGALVEVASADPKPMNTAAVPRPH